MRHIHARLIFLGGVIVMIASVVSIYLFLIPFLRSLTGTVVVKTAILSVDPVPIDPIYERDCEITHNVAITGYTVQNPFDVSNGQDCRTKCLEYNEANPNKLARCDYYSWHSASEVLMAKTGRDSVDNQENDENKKCHFISAMSAVDKTDVLGAYSGVIECTFSSDCLLKMRGVVRSGDVSIPRVFSPAECEWHCLQASPLECLYWTLYASGSIDTTQLDILDTCVLHRATKPVSSATVDGQADSWPVQIMRASLGTSLLSGRVCPSVGLDLFYLQNEVYELYGMDPPNNLDGGPVSGSSSDKFEPSQEELDEWFYSNTTGDGGLFPVDPEPIPIGPPSSQNSSCPYGLTKWYRDDDLFEFLGGDYNTMIQKDGSLIISPNPMEQGHIKPIGFGRRLNVNEEDSSVVPENENLEGKHEDLINHGFDLTKHDGLWVMSLKHVPVGCGVRRTIKLKSGAVESEISVMDSHNYQDYHTISLQTEDDCDMSLPYLMEDVWHPLLVPQQRGAWSRSKANDEDSRKLWNCRAPNRCTVESRIWRDGVPEPIYGGGGFDFNRAGGVLVVQVDRQRGIKIWNFAPDDIPYDLMINAPDPSNWSLRPTRTIAGEEKYLPAMANFPFVRGCESQSGCVEADVLQCPHLLDVCPDYMKHLHKSTIFTVNANGEDVSSEKIIPGYHPVGCHGYKNFEGLSLQFGMRFCDESASYGWNRDMYCSLMAPLGVADEAEDDIQAHCVSSQINKWQSLLLDAYWELYEIRLYETGAKSCYHDNVLRIPS